MARDIDLDKYPWAILIGISLWWLYNERCRLNIYRREVELSAKFREQSAAHFNRSIQHMDRVESALERIAVALTKQPHES